MTKQEKLNRIQTMQDELHALTHLTEQDCRDRGDYQSLDLNLTFRVELNCFVHPTHDPLADLRQAITRNNETLTRRLCRAIQEALAHGYDRFDTQVTAVTPLIEVITQIQEAQ